MKKLAHLTDLPYVGPATAGDLKRLGITRPSDLVDKDPREMYETLCRKDGRPHDICTLDVFASAIYFVNCGKVRPWWEFSRDRKKTL